MNQAKGMLMSNLDWMFLWLCSIVASLDRACAEAGTVPCRLLAATLNPHGDSPLYCHILIGNALHLDTRKHESRLGLLFANPQPKRVMISPEAVKIIVKQPEGEEREFNDNGDLQSPILSRSLFFSTSPP